MNDTGGEQRLRLILVWAVLVATAAVYIPTLTFAFVTDDTALLSAVPRWSVSLIPQFFAHHYWWFISTRAGIVAAYYRPLLLLYDFVVYHVGGAAAPAWHAVAILLHVAVTFLVYRMALALGGDGVMAISAAALFGLYPVHVEAVAWASGVSESLTAALILASFLCWVRRPTGRKYSLAALALFCLALLTKETAIIFPAVLLAFELRRTRLWTALRSIVWFIAVSLVYLFVRHVVLGGVMNTLMGVAARPMVLTWPHMALFYLQRLLWPVHMSYRYPLGLADTVTVKTILGMVLLAGFLVLAWRIHPFATCWTVLFLLPVMYIPGMTDLGIVHDRYLYLPSIGFCIICGTAFRQLYSVHRRFAIAGGMILLVLLASDTVAECRPWRDEAPLVRRVLEVNPGDDPRNVQLLLMALAKTGNCADGEPLAERALDAHEDASLRVSLAVCYLGESRVAEGEYQLQRALASDPDLLMARLMLASVRVSEGRFSDAEHELKQIARTHGTEWPGFHLLYGRVLESRGDRAGAAAEFRKELAVNPASQQAQDELDKTASPFAQP